MLRRISALFGILLVILMVTALVVTVHRHRQRMLLPGDDEAVPAASIQIEETRGELL
jgi:hypothetical protein